MANVISELPKISRKGAGGRRGSKYPLDEWFDGRVRELIRGTEEQFKAGEADYSAKDSSIVNMLHTKASDRDLKLRTVKTDDGIAVVVVAQITENGNTETADEPAKESKGKK